MENGWKIGKWTGDSTPDPRPALACRECGLVTDQRRQFYSGQGVKWLCPGCLKRAERAHRKMVRKFR